MKNQNRLDLSELSTVSFWIWIWEEVRRKSALKGSQEVHPERWAEFYEQVADLWSQMGGSIGPSNQEIIEELLLQKVIRPGQSVLDVGCGPGVLALPLAEQGLRVTALDSSKAMLAVVHQKAEASGIKGIKIIQSDWEAFKPRQRFDLVLAVGFPQACEPAGISRLESLSRSHCALIQGNGEDPFPFRRLLWPRLVKQPLPEAGLSLVCLLNYLLVTRKNPQIRTFSRPAALSQPLDRIVHFYKHYFALFGKKGPQTEKVIREMLDPYSRRGKLHVRGRTGSILIWWKKAERNRSCMRRI
jgi:SAM-dependent methyltransferase